MSHPPCTVIARAYKPKDSGQTRRHGRPVSIIPTLQIDGVFSASSIPELAYFSKSSERGRDAGMRLAPGPRASAEHHSVSMIATVTATPGCSGLSDSIANYTQSQCAIILSFHPSTSLPVPPPSSPPRLEAFAFPYHLKGWRRPGLKALLTRSARLQTPL